jgi:hypothetical protein
MDRAATGARLVRTSTLGNIITREDWERAKVVNDDLKYFVEDWIPHLDVPSLRRDSTTLRMLLVDGTYARAWRDVGLPGDPYISASDFNSALGKIDRKYLQLATSPPGAGVGQAIGAALVGKLEFKVIEDIPEGSAVSIAPGFPQHFGAVLGVLPKPIVDQEGSAEAALVRHMEPGRRHVRGFAMSDYLDSSCAYVLGEELTRREVIQYVAHKLGGAHFDPKRNRKGDDRLELLDRLSESTLVLNDGDQVNLVYVELFSIVEFLAESSDATRFRDTFAKIDPPD